MSTPLDIDCTITAPSGTLDLNNPGVYKLHSEALGEKQVQHRKQVAKNPYVEGEYVVSSVRENVTEPVAVWVYGSTESLLRARITALTDAFDQIQYQLVFRHEDSTETWTCQTADYTITRGYELRHAKHALIRAQVPRRPTVVFS